MPIHPANVLPALRRARGPIVWMVLAYTVGVLLGAAMVHGGNAFALRHRDSLVAATLATDSAALSLQHGQPIRAALLDFTANLTLGAVPSTVMGLGVVLPFPFAVYRGWIGGLVSVDGGHVSRLASSGPGAYYLCVICLQLIPYALAGGAGVRLGLEFLRPDRKIERWLGLPAEGVRDVLRIYALVVPLFLVASVVEFLAR